MKSTIWGGVLAAALASTAAEVWAVDRASTSKKGSLLVFTKVELRWDAAGNVIQDTFLDLTNDYPENVMVELYFVNGDAAVDAQYDPFTGALMERAHPGWNMVGNMIELTANEPAYWSALTGQPKGTSPFTILDPGFDANWNGIIEPFERVGRPDTDPSNPGGRVLRGFAVAFAVNLARKEIRWNHLKGDALIINDANGVAWEHNTWAFRALSVDHGEEPLSCDSYDPVTGECTSPSLNPGRLDLDAFEYDACPDRLLFDFYASGGPLVADTDLTLFLCDLDLRQERVPITTKADIDIWNQYEVKFSETERCITCWDQTLLSVYTEIGVPNSFLISNLGTTKGKARINGVASPVCDGSVATPLLGAAAKFLDFGVGNAQAGMTLVGFGEQSAQVFFDVPEPPTEMPDPFDGTEGGFGPQATDEPVPLE